MRHLGRWRRVTVVADAPWIEQIVHMLGFLLPSETEMFGLAKTTETRAWLSRDVRPGAA
jgi:hypothetical protein